MPTTSIDTILDQIIRREGGFVNDPSDSGGATNMGITRTTLKAWRERPVTIRDIKNLTPSEARAIYRDRYIKAPGLDRLPADLQPVMIDAAVHQGPHAAVSLLQNVLNTVRSAPIDNDGIIGPITIDAAHESLNRMGADLLLSVIEERRRFYYRLTAQTPALQKFLKGWLRRLTDFYPA